MQILFGKQPEFLSPGSCAKHLLCNSISLNPNGNAMEFAAKSPVRGFAGISAHLFSSNALAMISNCVFQHCGLEN